MLFWLALQSVRVRPRSWIVGLLAAGMALLLTLGAAFVESILGSTRRSLVESGTGDLQVYNASSPEPPLMVLGVGGPPELSPLPDYPGLESLLRSVDGVREVVPLEVDQGTIFRGNYLDDKLAAVRAVVREPPSTQREARLKLLAEDLARTLERVAQDARRRGEAFASDAQSQEELRTLEQVTSKEFWAHFSSDPLPALELLENKVARQMGEGEMLFLSYLGTDLPRFAAAFPRFELLTGQLPPPGERGILIGHGVYEQSFKLPIAFRLDELKRAHERGNTLAGDERLRTLVDRNVAEIGPLVARLDVERASALGSALARVLGHEGSLDALFAEFLRVEDGNLEERHQLFYRELAPHLPLYRVVPGDTLAVKREATVPVRVWGTFHFRGLGGDNSHADSLCLMDLVTTRYLSGRQTQAQKEEARQLITSFGMSNTENLELSVGTLGRPAIVEGEVKTSPGAPEPVFDRAVGPPPTYSVEELQSGSVLQAALVLEPEVSGEAVAERVQQLIQERKLPVQTASWEEVGGLLSGVVGMTQVLLVVLGALMGFFVLLVAAGTLMLLARERVGEVGTMRAVGMQRREVFIGLLLEGLLLGVVGSAVGVALGALLLRGAFGGGIGVSDEMLQFFLGGPVLQPRLLAGHVLAVGLGVVSVVTGAAVVPAWRGSSVAPIVAMRRSED